MATKIRPIVFRVNEPEGFVMDASNATINSNVAAWEGPNYPDGYDGEGKTLQIIVKEEGFTCNNITLYYSSDTGGYGPPLINDSDLHGGKWFNPADSGSGTASIPVGTYNVTIIHNQAGSGSGFGKYITLMRNGADSTLNSTLLSKIEFRIID